MKKPKSKRPAFPGRFPKMKTFSDERGVSPVIAVILMVAITVVLASVLYVMVTSIIIKPPDQDWGRLDCEKDDEPGEYTLTYTGSRNLEEIEISVIDKSIPQSMVLDPETETSKEIQDGISLTYMDVNMNNKLDGVDLLLISGGEDGDTVSVADKDGNNVVKCDLK
jgi:flagellin-like protein